MCAASVSTVLRTLGSPVVGISELCAWLASNVNRVGYVDEARDDCGPGKSIVDDLQLGQLAEKREVLAQVTAFLECQEPGEV